MRWLAGVIGVVIVLTAAPAGAEEISVETLLADPAAFEGEVTLRGELVGDFGFRTDGWVWTQLNDDTYAAAPVLEGGPLTGSNVGVGVRMPASLADGLGAPGGYRQRGPLVEVTGIWRYHDPERGGESYLEIAELHVVEPARALSEDPDWRAILVGIALWGSATILWWSQRRRRLAA